MTSFFKRHEIFIVALLIVIFGVGGVIYRYQKSVEEQKLRQMSLSQAERPIAILDRTSHDWGSIDQKNTVMEYFTLFNQGGVPLQVKTIVTSCGCTTAELVNEPTGNKYQTFVPPKGEAKIKVAFDPSAHDSKGKTNRAVRIETNDPENPFLIIQLFAYVK